MSMQTGLMVLLPEGTSAETHLKFPPGTRYRQCVKAPSGHWTLRTRLALDRTQTEESKDGVPLGHRVTNYWRPAFDRPQNHWRPFSGRHPRHQRSDEPPLPGPR